MGAMDDLPEEVKAVMGGNSTPNEETLSAIGIAIAAKRDEAKTARSASGIEETWRECEEAYLGIDDTNRGEYSAARWSKPTSMEGPLTAQRSGNTGEEAKSTAYVRLTARYVDAGASKVGEILLPIDDKPFSFGPTPVPDLIKGKEDLRQVVHNGMPLTRPARPDELNGQAAGLPPAAPPPLGAVAPPAIQGGPGSAPPAPIPTSGEVTGPGVQPAEVPLTVKDLAEEHLQIAEKKAKAAEKRIADWLVECQHPSEMRKVIFDTARIGVGVLKAPVPKVTKAMALQMSQGGMAALQIMEKITPSSKWADPWNIYPDPACGENIQNGDYIFEVDFLSERQLRRLKKLDGYIASAIDKVIVEGPGKSNVDSNGNPNQHKKNEKHRYEVWYYYGVLKKDDMMCCYAAGTPEKSPDMAKVIAGKQDCYCIVTLVNDTVIRATLNPLDSGEFPYHAVPWQRRAGHWAGVGVSEQCRMPQRVINAATRAMLNNAGKSAGSQIIIDQGAIVPADGNWTITPDKIWLKVPDAIVDDVRKAFTTAVFPNMTPQLMTIIEYAFRLAEESTSIPLITQGMSGNTTPDTYGATQLQNNNANQLLRSIGYTFDDYITEPVIRQFYEWLLLDPEVPEDEKGDFQINAHGSIALVERAIQDQTIMQMGAMVTNPAFGVDPKKWFSLMARAKRLDPRDLQYTPEEMQKMAQTPPPKAPAVEAAQIRAASAEKIAAEGGQVALQKIKVDTDRDTVYVQSERERNTAEAAARLEELKVKREIAMLNYANQRQISLDAVKGGLAKTAMTLKTQKELAGFSTGVDLHKHHNAAAQVATSAVEPPGKAKSGMAFQQ